jgi:DNA-binding NarL/FixJ family response regulator
MPQGRGLVLSGGVCTRVVIVVPNPVVRAGVRTLVGDQPGIEVAGTTEAVAGVAAADRPDVLLVDTMLRLDILELVRRRDPALKVVALVTAEVPPVAELREYVAAGVDGIVSTAEDIGDSLLAIRSGRAPGGWISPTLGADILRRGEPSYRPAEADSSQGQGAVTPSEHLVLRLVADGHTDREIASRLQRSERVVKYHVSNLLAKLQARNRAHIVKLAVRSGLLPTTCPCGQGAGVRTTRDLVQ